jgi:hypothetical protein
VPTPAQKKPCNFHLLGNPVVKVLWGLSQCY